MCVSTQPVISLLREVRILEEPYVLVRLTQKPVWSVYRSRQLILNIEARILAPDLHCVIAGSTNTHLCLPAFID